MCRTLEAWFPGCCFIVQLWVFILVESLPELQRAGLGWAGLGWGLGWAGLGWAGAEEQTLIESFSKLWLRILRIPSPHNQGEGEHLHLHHMQILVCEADLYITINGHILNDVLRLPHMWEERFRILISWCMYLFILFYYCLWSRPILLYKMNIM